MHSVLIGVSRVLHDLSVLKIAAAGVLLGIAIWAFRQGYDAPPEKAKIVVDLERATFASPLCASLRHTKRDLIISPGEPRNGERAVLEPVAQEWIGADNLQRGRKGLHFVGLISRVSIDGDFRIATLSWSA